MKNKHLITGILLLGGSGARFGTDIPKQFQRLSGKKIYLHTLERFLEIDGFHEIIIVAHPDYLEEVNKDIQVYANEKIKVVPGGASRQSSSFQGLLHCSKGTEYVVIHDAVRPFVTKEILRDNIEKVVRYGAVDTCAPSFDTIVESFDGKNINRIPMRSHYLRGQTPQSFSYDVIVKAHRQAIAKNLLDASDDCRLVLEDGHDVHVVHGDEKNIKITTELDLFLAEQLMRLSRKPSFQESQQSLRGKTYIVVGGTGGIGNAVCEHLKIHHAIPIPLSRSSAPYSIDLKNGESVEQAFAEIHRDFGPVDGLINCAGLLKIKELQKLSYKEIQELLHINLHGVIFCCKYCQINAGGHIINIASSSFTRGRKNYSIYSGSKAAVVNFTQGLAEEYADLNVNAVVPQRTLTPLRTANFPHEDGDTLLDPSEVAKTIVELLNQQGLTGQIIEVRK